MIAHDREHDQRVADQYEQRQHDGRSDLRAERGEIEPAPSEMKKNSSRKSRRRQPRPDGVAELGRRERNPGQKAAQFLAEADGIAAAARPAAHPTAKITISSASAKSGRGAGPRHIV
jgi:hypothetical protein